MKTLLQIQSEFEKSYKYLRYESPFSGFVFLLIIFWELGLVFSPIAGNHAWRQASTAAVAHNFALESANIFYPRIDWRMEFSGITGMEFPLYQYVTSFIYYFIPTYFDWPGKLVSFIFSLLLLRELILAFKKIPPLFIFSSYFLIIEVLVLSSRFMPDIFALFLSFKGWRYYDSKKYTFSLFYYLLGVLCRPYLIFLCIPILWDFIYDYFKKKIINIKIFSIGIIILFFLYLWYFKWSEYLRLNFGISDRFYRGDYKNFVINLTDINNYIIFIKVLHDNYINILLLPFLILGIKKYFDLKKIILFIITIMGVMGVTGSHVSPHSYYLIATIPIITYFLSNGFYYYRLEKTILILVILTLASNWYNYNPQQKIYDSLSSIQNKLNTLENDEGLVVVESNASPHALHILRSRGWIANTSMIRNFDYLKELEQKGVKYVYPLINNKYYKYHIIDWINNKGLRN